MSVAETPPAQSSGPRSDQVRTPDVDIAIVGCGFAGLGMAIRLEQSGIEDFVILERAQEIGGTWRDNTYPGCQCDVPSRLYSFSFELKADWSRTFPLQAEIQAYLLGCFERHGLERHLRRGHEVRDAAWDEPAQMWRIETSQGPLSARVLVSGMGALSDPALPDIPGIDSFEGTMFHSATWDHDHNLDGERVAVVGTGASSIQFVPRIQPRVGHLHLFQRTPPWIMPHPDRAVSRIERLAFRWLPGFQRVVRTGMYLGRESWVIGFLHERVMRLPERIARRHLRRQVPDPGLRRKLRPDYRIGCKRILLSNDYYPAVSQSNVEVIGGGIAEVRPHSVVAADGTEREVDTIIFGTGFHVTDMPAAQHVRGRDGRTLDEVWQGSPRALCGTAIPGFPNLFMLVGPNTGLGHTSMVVMIEAQVEYVLDCLRHMQRERIGAIDAREEAEIAFNRQLQTRMQGTVWTSGCASWYLDDTGRNTTLWPGSTLTFRRRLRHFDPREYELMPARAPVAAGLAEVPA